MSLSVGDIAPDFTLKTKTPEGLKDVRLSDNFGKKQTVLLFFPLAFTGVCTQEMCDMTAGLGAYASLGADVIAVSVDSRSVPKRSSRKAPIDAPRREVGPPCHRVSASRLARCVIGA